MWLTAAIGVAAGREPFGFPKKIAYIVARSTAARRTTATAASGTSTSTSPWSGAGYLIHTATGKYDDAELPAKPAFYGDPEYGRMNLRLITEPDLM